MSDLFTLLTNGSDECQVMYSRTKQYWQTKIPELMNLESNKTTPRQDKYLSTYKDFIYDFPNEIQKISEDLENIAERLLGCSLQINNMGPVTITMLEIYADGIWDESGDLIKGIFQNDGKPFENSKPESLPHDIQFHNKKGNYLFMSKLLEGPRIYFYNGRLDIKILGEFLPFSLLIRQFRNSKGELVTINGNPKPFIIPVNSNKNKPNRYEEYGSANLLFTKEDVKKLKEIAQTDQAIIYPSNGNVKHHVTISDRKESFPEDNNIVKRPRIESGRVTGLHGLYKYQSWNLTLRKKPIR